LKIRLDECIANRVALAVIAITDNREGYEVSFIRHGEGSPDPDWIRKFALDGGTAIVSGDHNILQHWPNLVAYTESGLISFFPPSEYEHLRGFARAAFIIRWWPAIIEKVKRSARGDRWRLPMVWHSTDHTKMKPIKDPRIDYSDDSVATTELRQNELNLEASHNGVPNPS
jgi:PIN like domain